MNAPSRILVVFYSRSETTAEFAGRLAAELEGDYERLHEVEFRRRVGPLGFLLSILDVVRKRPAHLQPMTHTLADYDVVLIGTPVWAARASAPVATWLSLHWHQMRTVAFFCTMGGRGSEDAFAQMEQLARRAPIATCAISARDMRTDPAVEKVSRFVLAIKDALAAREHAAAAR
ncbi:flavodoxin [Paraburkholderia sp. CNPSo 3274]|uniref:flavodoxin family protein n=1 Tax=Paraburkholderia sp. CNPSo 3274 TaxID=2940932 RepID=UPI0020B84A56|nr:flavodoxin [Paraburkholderia sp. CNPSo 3274]MCP3710081.1 flavodoxin [Paraburkholderia sp. CNPSo 3274]